MKRTNVALLLAWLPAMVVATVIFGVYLLRVEGLGRHHLANADAARTRGDWSLAILHAREAASAAPMPAARAGYEKLAEIAEESEARADWDTAAAANLGILAASHASRGALFSSSRWTDRASQRLVELGTIAAQNRTRTPRDGARALSDVSQDPTRSPWAAGACGAFFGLFVFAAWRALRKERSQRQAPAWAVWLSVFAFLALMFVEVLA